MPTVMVFSKSSPPVSHTAEEDTPEADLKVAIEVYGKTVDATLAAAAAATCRRASDSARRPLRRTARWSARACASSRSTPSATPTTCSPPRRATRGSGTTCPTARSPTSRSCGRISTERADSTDPLFLAIIDTATGRASGVVSYLRIAPEHGCIEIGHIWFGAPLQRTPAATETIYLLARHAFDDLGNRRLEWKCDAANARSRRAAERFGFTYEGVFRQHMIVKGRNRDTAWFSLLDSEWPAARAALRPG